MGCVPFLRRFALNLVRAWEKRDRAIYKIRDVDRVGQRVHCCRHRLAAHSRVHDFDVAIIHVPGAAGVAVERRDIGVSAHRDKNDVFVLIDCNAASQDVRLVISGAVWERTYQDSRRRRLRTT